MLGLGSVCGNRDGTAPSWPVHVITFNAASQGKSEKRSAARKIHQQKGIILLLPHKSGREGVSVGLGTPSEAPSAEGKPSSHRELPAMAAGVGSAAPTALLF